MNNYTHEEFTEIKDAVCRDCDGFLSVQINDEPCEYCDGFWEELKEMREEENE